MSATKQLMQLFPHDAISVEIGILPQNALIDPDLCTLVPHLKVEVNGP